ncbi:hypothetical protein C3L33_00323, partial [Rhododendron williamsianum]
MASTACFMIVSRNDIPIYEAEVGSAVKVSSIVGSTFLFYSLSNFQCNIPSFSSFSSVTPSKFVPFHSGPSKLRIVALPLHAYMPIKKKQHTSTSSSCMQHWILSRTLHGQQVLCEIFQHLILSLCVSILVFLKAIDRFNDLVVSVYVTAGHILHNF